MDLNKKAAELQTCKMRLHTANVELIRYVQAMEAKDEQLICCQSALRLTKEDAQEKLWNQKDIQSQCQEELLKAAEEIQKLSQHLAHRDESQKQVLEDAIGQPGRGSNKTNFELREILAKSMEREVALQKKVGQK